MLPAPIIIDDRAIDPYTVTAINGLFREAQELRRAAAEEERASREAIFRRCKIKVKLLVTDQQWWLLKEARRKDAQWMELIDSCPKVFRPDDTWSG